MARMCQMQNGTVNAVWSPNPTPELRDGITFRVENWKVGTESVHVTDHQRVKSDNHS